MKGLGLVEVSNFATGLGKDLTLTGAGEVCFRGLFYEVSLALVGVASPA
jgi:hypothetical protein